MTTWPRLWLPLCGALLIAMPLASQAQDYPTRPITVVVPFPAGGLTDVPARVAATMMSEKIGQNLVVENKTGATGTIGAAFAARAAPDGYTLFANSLADAQNIHFQTLTYSPVDDFQQIGWRGGLGDHILRDRAFAEILLQRRRLVGDGEFARGLGGIVGIGRTQGAGMRQLAQQ